MGLVNLNAVGSPAVQPAKTQTSEGLKMTEVVVSDFSCTLLRQRLNRGTAAAANGKAKHASNLVVRLPKCDIQTGSRAQVEV